MEVGVDLLIIIKNILGSSNGIIHFCAIGNEFVIRT